MAGCLFVNPGAVLREVAVDSGDTGADRAGGTFGILELPKLSFTLYRSADGAVVEVGDGAVKTNRGDRARRVTAR